MEGVTPGQVYAVLDACGIKYRRVPSGVVNQPCHCPFHEDRRPSFRIDVTRGVWVCFSCGRKGNLVTLARDILGVPLGSILDGGEATVAGEASALFSRLRIGPTSWAPSAVRGQFPPVSVEGEVVGALDSEVCRAYIERRGFDPEIVRSLGLRYTDRARVNGLEYRQRLLVFAGLKGETYLVEGRDVTGGATPKVLYPPKSFRGFVYRVDVVDPGRPLYLVEGTTDLLRVFPYSANVVSTFGATLTSSQVAQLEALAPSQLVVVADRDEAGTRLVETLSRSLSCDVWVAPIPYPYKDIGDVPQRAVPAVLSRVVEAPAYLRQGGHLSMERSVS